MAMVLKSYGTNVTPVDTAAWSQQNGYRVEGSGTAWTFFDAIGKANGLTTNQFLSIPTAKDYLSKNIPVIGSMKPGDFTKGGHFIVFTGYDGNNVVVNDPSSRERSAKTWGADHALSQAKQFWAVSKNGQGSIKSGFSNVSSSSSASENTNAQYNSSSSLGYTAGTGSGLPIIDFTRDEYNDLSRKVPSSRKSYSNQSGGASGVTLPVTQNGSYSNMDPKTLLQFFNQVIALLTSIAQSSGYTPTIVSVLQMMTGTMTKYCINDAKT